MVSFRSQKKLGPRPDRSPLGGLNQNFRRASLPLSSTECPPPHPGGYLAPFKMAASSEREYRKLLTDSLLSEEVSNSYTLDEFKDFFPRKYR